LQLKTVLVFVAKKKKEASPTPHTSVGGKCFVRKGPKTKEDAWKNFMMKISKLFVSLVVSLAICMS
jgi:hypothetical protein